MDMKEIINKYEHLPTLYPLDIIKGLEASPLKDDIAAIFLMGVYAGYGQACEIIATPQEGSAYNDFIKQLKDLAWRIDDPEEICYGEIQDITNNVRTKEDLTSPQRTVLIGILNDMEKTRAELMNGIIDDEDDNIIYIDNRTHKKKESGSQ